MNPRNRECVESDIVEELIEVIFKLADVATDVAEEPVEEEEQLREEARDAAGRGMLASQQRRRRVEDELEEEEAESRPAIRKYLPREEHVVEHKWSLERLLQEFRALNDNVHGYRKVNILDKRKKEVLYEHFKEYSFQPQINKRS